jgi:hypothetical protein
MKLKNPPPTRALYELRHVAISLGCWLAFGLGAIALGYLVVGIIWVSLTQ